MPELYDNLNLNMPNALPIELTINNNIGIFSCLSNEVICYIFSFMDLKGISSMLRTCRGFEFLSEPIWRELYKNTFKNHENPTENISWFTFYREKWIEWKSLKGHSNKLYWAAKHDYLTCSKIVGQQINNQNNLKEMIQKSTHDNCSPLFEAISLGNTSFVKWVIQLFPDMVNFKFGSAIKNFSMLYLACQNGHIELIKFLLDSGALIDDQRIPSGSTPLFIAAQKGHVAVVKLLISYGAKIDCALTDPICTGATPLYVSSGQGHTEVVNILLDAGAEINCKIHAGGEAGSTPIYCASAEGYAPTVRLLGSRGANIESSLGDAGPATPLYIAAQKGHLDTVKLLIEELHANIESYLLFGETSLYIAALHGHKHIIEYLLSKGANPNSKLRGVHNGVTPLYIASQKNYADCIEVLLNAGAKIDAPVSNINFPGSTPLYVAASQKSNDAVKILIKRGANVNAYLTNSPTPGASCLYIASQNANVEGVKMLLAAGADPNAELSEESMVCGATPLFISAQMGNDSVLPILLAGGANINSRIKSRGVYYNYTALHAAIYHNNQTTAQILINQQININIQAGLKMETALHMATKQGLVNLIKVLLEAGADKTIKNIDGETASDLAYDNGEYRLGYMLRNSSDHCKIM